MELNWHRHSSEDGRYVIWLPSTTTMLVLDLQFSVIAYIFVQGPVENSSVFLPILDMLYKLGSLRDRGRL
jgi:hypothetical protein